jgi:acyl carrier protein
MTRSPRIPQALFEDVKAVVVATLDIEDQADDLEPETGLYGNLAELDSLTVVRLIVALQKRFAIEIKIDELASDIFDTLGRLTAFVESRVRCEPLCGATTAAPGGAR